MGKSNKICPNCERKMKQQVIGLQHCRCGMSWKKDIGFFERTPDMVFGLRHNTGALFVITIKINHLLCRCVPKYSMSEIMGYLKEKSSLMIFERHANLKYKYGNRHFWCRGHYVDTVGKNAKKIGRW